MDNSSTPIFTTGDFKNFNYIIRHKRNLLKAFNMFISCIHLFKNNDINMDVDFIDLKNRVLKHDLDKFNPEIFYAYTKKFYNETDEKAKELKCQNKPFPDYMLAALDLDSKEEIEDQFEEAYNKHYASNKHHPEYWKKMGKTMEDIDNCEMCIDFTAMSIKYGGRPYDYYKKEEKDLKKDFGNIINYELVESVLKVISENYNFQEVHEKDEQEE